MRSLTSKILLVAVGTFLIAVSAINARATYGAKISVDEPQYLLTALSIAEDQDLDISDELEEQRYLSFHEVPLNQQTIDLTDDGQRLSPHDPLLPILLSIPMGLGGWAAAKIMLAAIAAITASITLWVVVKRFHVSENIAACVVGVCFMAPPLVSYGTQIYPEMPAALCVIVGIGIVTSPVVSRSGLIGLILVINSLPWLSVKYVPVAATVAVFALIKIYKRNKQESAALGVFLAVSALLYLIAHQKIYGGWTVYASGDHFVDGEFRVVGNNPNILGRTRRLSGLLLDKDFGLIPWAPAYFALIPACIWLLKSKVKDSLILLSVVGAGWAVATWVALTMHGWWWPGRQTVVVLPAVIVVMCLFAEKSKHWFRFIVLGGAAGMVGWVWLAIESSTGNRTLVVDFYETTYPIYRALSFVMPDFTNFNNSALLLNLVWLSLIAVFSFPEALRKQKDRLLR